MRSAIRLIVLPQTTSTLRSTASGPAEELNVGMRRLSSCAKRSGCMDSSERRGSRLSPCDRAGRQDGSSPSRRVHISVSECDRHRGRPEMRDLKEPTFSNSALPDGKAAMSKTAIHAYG